MRKLFVLDSNVFDTKNLGYLQYHYGLAERVTLRKGKEIFPTTMTTTMLGIPAGHSHLLHRVMARVPPYLNTNFRVFLLVRHRRRAMTAMRCALTSHGSRRSRGLPAGGTGYRTNVASSMTTDGNVK